MTRKKQKKAIYLIFPAFLVTKYGRVTLPKICSFTYLLSKHAVSKALLA